MATGPDHYREAEQLLAEAADWADADYGWKAGLSGEERIARRTADLAEAHVHATLALAAAVGVSRPAVVDGQTAMTDQDIDAWMVAASENRRPTGGEG